MDDDERKGFRNVLALGLVSFFTDASTEMCLSMLPVFFIYELGGGKALLGLMEGVAEGMSHILRVFSGILSDRFRRRKPLILAGYTISNLLKPWLSVARTWADAIAIRVGDRVGKGVRTAPRDALLSESVSGKVVGKAFGIHRTLDQAGAIVGPALAFLLLPFFGTRGIFLFSIVPGVLALVVLALFVSEVGQPTRRSESMLRDVRLVLRGDFVKLLAIMALFSVGAFNFSFILVRAGELGVPETFIPLIYVAINVVHTAVAMPAGFLSDRIGREATLLIGYLAFSASAALLMALGYGAPNALTIAAVYGMYAGIVDTAQRAVLPKYSPPGLRGTAYGVYFLVVGLALLAANSVFGALWQTFGMRAASLYSLATSAAASAALAVFVASRAKPVYTG